MMSSSALAFGGALTVDVVSSRPSVHWLTLPVADSRRDGWYTAPNPRPAAHTEAGCEAVGARAAIRQNHELDEDAMSLSDTYARGGAHHCFV